MGRWQSLLLTPLCCLAVGSACSSAQLATPDAPGVARPTRSFSFVGADGAQLNSESTRGRVTALLFVTTYDLQSQLMLSRMAQLLGRHQPRINVGAVVVEPPRYESLIPTFRTSLGLTYPVVLATHATLTGKGPFGVFERLPVLVILDRAGREVSRHGGVLEVGQVESLLRLALEP